jgi:CrcB protein
MDEDRSPLPPFPRAPLAVAHERQGVVLVLVFLGGALGALARESLVPLLPAPWFWVPILLVNVFASFLMGWFFTLRGRWHPYWTHMLVGGFCGGFSTFSHFTYELVTLADAARLGEALVYMLLAVMLGLAAAIAGERFGARLHGAAR